MSYGFRGPRQPYGGYGRPSAPIVHRPPMQRPPNMSRPRAPMGNRPWGHAFANLHNNQDEQFEKEVPMHLVTIDHVKEWLTRQHPMVN